MSDFHALKFATRTERARTEIRCEECKNIIPAGIKYCRLAGSFDGDFYSATTCEFCEAIRMALWANWHDDADYFAGLGDMREWAKEQMEQSGSGPVDGWPLGWPDELRCDQPDLAAFVRVKIEASRGCK
jgi:hypothetical protein